MEALSLLLSQFKIPLLDKLSIQSRQINAIHVGVNSANVVATTSEKASRATHQAVELLIKDYNKLSKKVDTVLSNQKEIHTVLVAIAAQVETLSRASQAPSVATGHSLIDLDVGAVPPAPAPAVTPSATASGAQAPHHGGALSSAHTPAADSASAVPSLPPALPHAAPRPEASQASYVSIAAVAPQISVDMPVPSHPSPAATAPGSVPSGPVPCQPSPAATAPGSVPSGHVSPSTLPSGGGESNWNLWNLWKLSS